MIIGSSITRGYQEMIQSKFYDCWGHIHITKFMPDPSNLQYDECIALDSNLVQNLSNHPDIKSVNAYNIQSAILKTKQDIEGVLLKGISRQTQFGFADEFLIQGKHIEFHDSSYSTDIIISENIANKLSLKVGDHTLLYFIINNEQQPSVRKIKIAGIYKTGLEDYDNVFVLADMKLINHVNRRDASSIHGYEIAVQHPSKINEIESELFDHYIQAPLQTYTIEQRFVNVFSWLDMMKMNERIIILIMLIIAIINMVSAFLILVLERTQMIGILKSIGMRNGAIKSVFIYTGIYILSIGLLVGTSLGIGLCLLQQKTGLLQLDEKTYYVKTVPISLHPEIILGINALTLIVTLTLLLVPALMIRKLSPTKALQFK